jgi:hypothetical protein
MAERMTGGELGREGLPDEDDEADPLEGSAWSCVPSPLQLMSQQAAISRLLRLVQ